MLTYEDYSSYTRVLLDGKHVGDINECIGGEWFYHPKSASKSMRGERMKTRDAVKRSLESE